MPERKKLIPALVRNMKNIPGSPCAEEAQLQAVKGTITLLKKALSHTKKNSIVIGVSPVLGPLLQLKTSVLRN